MHEDFRDDAIEMIREDGSISQLVSITNSGESWNPVRTETSADVFAVNVQIKNSDIDGDLIRHDDLMFLIDSSVEPKLSDRFLHDNKKYEIKRIKKVKPADTTIFYKIQVRL